MSQVPDFSKHDHSQITLIVSGTLSIFTYFLFQLFILVFSIVDLPVKLNLPL